MSRIWKTNRTNAIQPQLTDVREKEVSKREARWYKMVERVAMAATVWST